MCNCFKCISINNCDRADKYKTLFEKRMNACKNCSVHSDCELCKYSTPAMNGILICTNSDAWGLENGEATV